MLEGATTKRLVGNYEFADDVLGVIYDAWYLDLRYLVGIVWHKHKGHTSNTQYLQIKDDLEFVTIKARLLRVLENNAKYLSDRYNSNVRPESRQSTELGVRESTIRLVDT